MQGQSSTWVSSIYSLLGDARVVFTAAVLLRVSLLEYGYWQDHYSAVKYTDIDYFVFTDAARNVAQGQSPYLRDTYRYTPLLAWLLVPTTWSNAWFAFGKVLFSAGDILTGWLMTVILRDHGGMSNDRAIRLSTIWLLNPMVATISTRGSSEGLLAVMVMALLWAALQRRVLLAGFFLGLGVHFKIYPFVYAVSIAWWLDSRSPNVVEARKESSQVSISSRFKSLMTPARITFAVSSAATFAALNGFMFLIYGVPFLEHTFFYHLIRTDHRHNFSPYSTMLYQHSSLQSSQDFPSRVRPESVAFIPQLALSALFIPLALARRDLASSMLAQTYAFVTFNKVCTSQYFLWYMIFLPFYLPKSTFMERPVPGCVALGLWIAGQGLWLGRGYQLEFLGLSSFVPGLWSSSLVLFLINVGLLGVIIGDVRLQQPYDSASKSKAA